MDYDIIIVGCGLAGLACASKLSGSGLKVLAIEQNPDIFTHKIRYKASFESIMRQNQLLSCINRYYDKTAFYSNAYKAKVSLKKDRACLVDTHKMFSILKNRSKGIDFKFNTEIVDVLYYGKGIVITDLNNNSYTSKLIIDTSGRSLVCLQSLGVERSNTYYQFYGVDLKNVNIDPNEAPFFLDSRYSNSGWWVYPYSKDKCQIAIGYLEPLLDGTRDDLRTALLKVLREYTHYDLRSAKIIPGSDFHVKYPINPIKSMAVSRVIGLGDSCAHATPLMGEGIRPILDLSDDVVRVVMEAFLEDDFSEEKLSKFDDIWWDKYGKHYFWLLLLRKVSISNFGNEEWTAVFRKFDSLSNDEKSVFVKSRMDMRSMEKLISFKLINRMMKKTFEKRFNIKKMFKHRTLVSEFI